MTEFGFNNLDNIKVTVLQGSWYLNGEKMLLLPPQALERAGVPTANENKEVKKSSGSSPPGSVEGMQEAGQQMSAALTVRRLLVRRGLSLVLMIIILATAVCIAELLNA